MVNETDEAVRVCATVSVPFGEKTAVTLLLMDGTAHVGLDYSGSIHQVVFSPGESEACVSIPIINDDRCEVTESFSVKLTEPSITGTYLLGEPKSCSVSIKDDESNCYLYHVNLMYCNCLNNTVVATYSLNVPEMHRMYVKLYWSWCMVD